MAAASAMQFHGHTRPFAAVLRWAGLAVMVLLQACATVTNPDARDPLESWNRGVFGFNEVADRAVLKPVATVYRDATPQLVQKGMKNFLNNLEDVWSAFNTAIQFRGQETGDNLGRVMVNTTIGMLGLFDVASDLSIERHPANFGLTLGRWGLKPGPYLVLPLLGPSSLRDTAALPIDAKGSLVGNTNDAATRNVLTVIDVVRTRASYLGAEGVVDGAALDKYSFMRDAYLQRRRNQVYDGDPPEEEPQPDEAALPVPSNSPDPKP
jgi:phospholipid-binding lipoprotein MlaA